MQVKLVMKVYIQNILLFSLSLLLLGCSSSEVTFLNEGAVEHRKFSAKTNKAIKEGEKRESPLLKQYDTTNDSGVEIKENDSISIHLMQGMVDKLPFAEAEGNDIGEVAIVVKAQEMIETTDLDFSEKSADSGRLIFYSDDVSAKQVLNFSYLPVYGPITYHGNPVVIQIYIIEIKKSDLQVKPILSTLAQSGSTMLPPGSPTLSLLDNLGSTLLSSNKDNIIFK